MASIDKITVQKKDLDWNIDQMKIDYGFVSVIEEDKDNVTIIGIIDNDKSIPPWLKIAWQELGVKEDESKEKANPRIVEYLKTTSDVSKEEANSDETYWCAAFVNFCVKEAGIKGTNSAGARSWEDWGEELKQPIIGCIAVFKRTGGGHVGFYIGSEEDNNILLLGGNQDNKVCIERRTTENLLSYRWFNAIEKPSDRTSNTQSTEALDKVLQIAEKSAIASYKWKEHGVAPHGYIKGMAVVYARVYYKLKAGDAVAQEMAKANTGNTEKDALAHYEQEFQNLGMSNNLAGVNTLRHLFVLLIGLGMRESSGKYWEGMYKHDGNTKAETAEAGLFQTSYNTSHVSALLPQIFERYLANPSGFIEIFKEGIPSPEPDALINYGEGKGKEFQRLSKSCPAFAAEYTAVALRNIRQHWGPINRKEVEIRLECDKMLLEVQEAVDTFNLCPTVL